MKPRSSLPQKERNARSKAAQLIHGKPLILGSIVEMANTCGKPNCKCTKGERHKSCCVSVRYKGKRKMLHISRGLEGAFFEAVRTYKELWEQLEIISEASLERIISSRKSKE
jgi:hypothetical protein